MTRPTSNKMRTAAGRSKSGARVRVRLTMVAQARRYHVALVDQLPAGLEILNPELATTEVIPADHGGTLRFSNTAAVHSATVMVLAAILVRTPKFPRRTRRSLYLAALGRRLQLFVCGTGNDARPVCRPARQGRGNVSSGNLWPNGDGFCECRIS